MFDCPVSARQLAQRRHLDAQPVRLSELDAFIHSRNIPGGEPIVITGDFNFGGPISPIQEKYGDGMPGYHELVEDVHVARDFQRYYEEVERKKDRIIDHILVRNAACDGDRGRAPVGPTSLPRPLRIRLTLAPFRPG